MEGVNSGANYAPPPRKPCVTRTLRVDTRSPEGMSTRGCADKPPRACHWSHKPCTTFGRLVYSAVDMKSLEWTPCTKPVEVRDHLVDVLGRDLVGAEPTEVLPVAPSRWYLTGFLVPREAPIEVREDPDPDETLASGGDDDGDDAAPPEVASARKAFFPSSIGLSILVPATTRVLSVRATWGEYKREEGSVRPQPAIESAGTDPQPAARPPERWRRTPKEAVDTFDIPVTGKVSYEFAGAEKARGRADADGKPVCDDGAEHGESGAFAGAVCVFGAAEGSLRKTARPWTGALGVVVCACTGVNGDPSRFEERSLRGGDGAGEPGEFFGAGNGDVSKSIG